MESYGIIWNHLTTWNLTTIYIYIHVYPSMNICSHLPQAFSHLWSYYADLSLVNCDRQRPIARSSSRASPTSCWPGFCVARATVKSQMGSWNHSHRPIYRSIYLSTYLPMYEYIYIHVCVHIYIYVYIYMYVM